VNKIFLYLSMAFCVLLLSAGCKTSHKTAVIQKTPEPEVVVVKGKTLGKVSHQFKAGGCSSVLIVDQQGENKPLTLIPMAPIPEKLDAEGTELYFDYHLLKRRNPDGCTTGIPAEISNISKK
jgi:hypothetical protein